MAGCLLLRTLILSTTGTDVWSLRGEGGEGGVYVCVCRGVAVGYEGEGMAEHFPMQSVVSSFRPVGQKKSK